MTNSRVLHCSPQRNDFAGIRFVDNQQQAGMVDDSAATAYSWLRQLSVTLARTTKLKKIFCILQPQLLHQQTILSLFFTFIVQLSNPKPFSALLQST